MRGIARTAAGLLIVLVSMSVVLFAPSAARACDPAIDPDCGATTTGDGWAWYWDKATQAFYKRPGTSFRREPEKWWYKNWDLRPAAKRFCGMIGCDDWLVCRKGEDLPVGFLAMQERRVNPVVWRTLSEDQRRNPPYKGWENWRWDWGSGILGTPVFCNAPSKKVTIQQVRDRLEDSWREKAPKPIWKTNPGPRALVNFPVILHAQKVEPQEYPVTYPVPGKVVATPKYIWRFDEGGPTTGAGRPYDGTSAQRSPDYYVTHTFESLGEHKVTLEVRWEAYIHVGNNDPVRLEDLVQAEARTLELVESRGLLSGEDE